MVQRGKRNRPKNRAVKITTTKMLQPFVPTTMTQQRIMPVPTLKKRRRARQPAGSKRMLTRVSPAGIAMLKCAYASPDFGVDPGMGIVDKFQGRIINIKDCVTTPHSFEENMDTFILVLPIPGYQFFIGVAPIGSVPVDFVGVPFPSYVTNYGDGSTEANNYTRFRYAAGAFGIYPTSNITQAAGSIQVWRMDANMTDTLFDATTFNPATVFRTQKVNVASADLEMGTFTSSSASGTATVQLEYTGSDYGVNRVGVAEHAGEPAVDTYGIPAIDSVARNAVQRNITGLQSVTSSAPRDSYGDSFIKGAFSVMTDRTDDFEWSNFVSSKNYYDGDMRLSGVDGKPLKGLGNLNGLIFKVTTPAGAVNTGLLKTWVCMEMQPNTNSVLYQHSKLSPSHDPVALQLYHDYASRVPVAVPCAQNGVSWKTFLEFAERALSLGGKYAPVIGQGLQWAAEAVGLINSLVF